MNKQTLLETFAEKESIKKSEAERLIDSLEETILSALKSDGEIALFGGKFKIKDVSAKDAREGRNPNTGEIVQVAAKPASKKLVFKVGKGMKETVSKM